MLLKLFHERNVWHRGNLKPFGKPRYDTVASLGHPTYTLMVRRNEVIGALSNHRSELKRLGITSLLMFGSVARDEAGPDSDVDLIAEFSHSVGFLELSRVQRALEEILTCRVNLATPAMIRQEFRDRIYAEAVRAA